MRTDVRYLRGSSTARARGSFERRSIAALMWTSIRGYRHRYIISLWSLGIFLLVLYFGRIRSHSTMMSAYTKRNYSVGPRRLEWLTTDTLIWLG